MATKQRAFTLIELLVVIAIIALLMSILMPSLQRVRKQARSVACMSNLKQWALIWQMYTDEANGRFNTGNKGTSDAANDWLIVLMPYYQDRGALTLCPVATRPMSIPGDFATRAWSWDKQGWSGLLQKNSIDIGSYGENEWICDRPAEQYWRSRNKIKDPATVPLFFDCGYVDAYPNSTTAPPDMEGYSATFNEWCLVALNRHSGYVNYLFADISVRKVGIKELWGLRWNRTFDIFNPWTKAGGVQSSDWPLWMRGFKEP